MRISDWSSDVCSSDLSVHQYQGMDYREYFAGAEAIFRNHGGRPHWGKIHTLSARDLEPLYPRWNDFLKLRASVDPDGMFINPWLRSEEHTSELQSLMRISYAVFCLKKKKSQNQQY